MDDNCGEWVGMYGCGCKEVYRFPHTTQGRIQGGSLGAEEPPSGKIHYKLSRGGFRGGFGGYHQPLSSLYMLDSVCQTPM